MLIHTHLNRKEQMEQLLTRATVLVVLWSVGYCVGKLSGF